MWSLRSRLQLKSFYYIVFHDLTIYDSEKPARDV